MGAAAQKRMKKHIFSENKCQTLVNKKSQEVNLTDVKNCSQWVSNS